MDTVIDMYQLRFRMNIQSYPDGSRPWFRYMIIFPKNRWNYFLKKC